MHILKDYSKFWLKRKRQQRVEPRIKLNWRNKSWVFVLLKFSFKNSCFSKKDSKLRWSNPSQNDFYWSSFHLGQFSEFVFPTPNFLKKRKKKKSQWKFTHEKFISINKKKLWMFKKGKWREKASIKSVWKWYKLTHIKCWSVEKKVREMKI